MPVNLSSAPTQAAIAATLRNNDGADASTVDANGLELFAAHFQRLMGKHLAVAVTADPATATAEPATAATEEPADDLAALLPFIEALGLTQAAQRPATESPTSNDRSNADPADAATAILAVPITVGTAISAATADVSGKSQAPGAPLPNALPAPTESSELAAPPPAVEVSPAREMSAGREFSTQLVAAIASSKETPGAGSTAAAVQQVIANALPAHVQPGNTHSTIVQPVGTPGWSEEISNRIAWMASRSDSRADLVLTPPQMGRIEVTLTMKGDQATANFVSSNPVVREALEAALPRLREVLADAGIQLGQTQVSAENARQWAQQEKHGDNFASDRDRGNPGNAAISQVSSGSLSSAAGLKVGRGLVDVFA